MKGRFCASCAYCVRTGATLWCAENDERIDGIKVCDDYEPIIKPKTNGDLLRAMSDVEMADWLVNKVTAGWCPRKASECISNCKMCWVYWLTQEAVK